MGPSDDPGKSAYLPLHRIEMEHAPLTVAAYCQCDVGHGRIAERDAAIWLLPRSHTIEKVVHMPVVALVAEPRDDDLFLAPLLDELFAIRLFSDDLRVIELTVLWSLPFVAQ